MEVWLIDQYASTPDSGTGGGGRHFYLAKELVKLGHRITIITACYHHLMNEAKNVPSNRNLLIEDFNGIKIVYVKVPSYKNAHDKKRVLNWFLFAYRLRTSLDGLSSPDVILGSSPSPFVSLASGYLAKKHKAKLIFEVRDIWPLTLIEIGGVSPFHPLILLMGWVEKRAYKSADIVMSNLKFAIDHLKSFGLLESRFYWLPNGFCKEEMDNHVELTQSELSQIPLDKFIVGYTGTIGLANALNYFVEAANLLKEYDDISFVIVGEGKEKELLQEKVRALNLTNVVFLSSIEKRKIFSMLQLFDACFIGWNRDSLYRFGISPNKVPEYLYSGKPIIHSFSGKGDLVSVAKAGYTVPAESPQEIANAIIRLKNLSQDERLEMGRLGQQYAVNELSYTQLAKKLEVRLTELLDE